MQSLGLFITNFPDYLFYIDHPQIIYWQGVRLIGQCGIEFFLVQLPQHLYKEEGVSRIFSKYGMVYPVELSYSPLGDIDQFPWIRPSKLLKAMSTTGDLPLALGGIPSIREARLRCFGSMNWSHVG